jgi:hypothetical protein
MTQRPKQEQVLMQSKMKASQSTLSRGENVQKEEGGLT